MDLDQEKYGSIDPKKLVVQDGENMGNVAADELSPGEIKTDAGIEMHSMIEGLPGIGAGFEQLARANLRGYDRGQIDEIKKAMPPGTTRKEAETVYFDEAGTNAMIKEIRKRSYELFPDATEELKQALSDQAVDSFMTELKAKNEERKKREEANTKVQAMIDKLKAGAPFSDTLPFLPDNLVGQNGTRATSEIPRTPEMRDDENVEHDDPKEPPTAEMGDDEEI